jgi:hypothetical protein
MSQKTILTKEAWLDSRGGRTLEDVQQDNLGEFVYMVGRNLHKRVKQKVYLPKR